MTPDTKAIKARYHNLLDEDIERLVKTEIGQLMPEALPILLEEIKRRGLSEYLYTVVKNQIPFARHKLTEMKADQRELWEKTQNFWEKLVTIGWVSVIGSFILRIILLPSGSKQEGMLVYPDSEYLIDRAIYGPTPLEIFLDWVLYLGILTTILSVVIIVIRGKIKKRKDWKKASNTK